MQVELVECWLCEAAIVPDGGPLCAIAMSRGASIHGLTREGAGSPNTSVGRARSSIRTA